MAQEGAPQQRPLYEIDPATGSIRRVGSAPSAAPTLPLTPQASGQPGLESMEPKEFLAGLVGALTSATGFLPGTRLPAMALRTALGASGDALAAGIEGEDPLQAAARGGAVNTVGETGAKLIPGVMTRVALASGSSLKELKNVGKYADAFNREANRRRVPIVVGERDRIKSGLKKAGAHLEATETATPGSVPLRQMQGANADLHSKQLNTMDTFKNQGMIDAADKTFIETQALARNGMSPADFNQQVGQLHAATRQARLINPGTGLPWTQAEVREVMMNHLIDNTQLGARDLGELYRGVRQPGLDVVKARQGGEYLGPDEQLRGSIHANNADNIKKKYTSLDRDTRTPMQRLRTDVDKGGDMERANQRVADLSMMKEASEGIRRDLSAYGIRGAIAGNISPWLGIPWQLGSLLGILSTPQNLSGLGFAAGRASKYGPTFYRANEATEDFQEGTGVKRRKPGGK